MKIINFNQYENIRKAIKDQCEKTKMWTRGSQEKKINAILDSICISIINADLTTEDIEQLLLDINNNEAIDNSILKNGGNLWNFVKPRWVRFAKELFKQRTVGIGTPNAASGEGELMFLFLDGNEVSKPTKGDLKIGNVVFEIKGDGPRIMGNISGKNFRDKTLRCAERYGIQPNNSTNNGSKAVELEKTQHKEFYWNQLSRLALNVQKDFCNDWLKCIDNQDHTTNVQRIFKNDRFNFESLRKEILKCLFRIHLQENPFDYYVILGDGNDVKIISSSIEEFDEKIDSNKITLLSDYFRVNQNYPIGWYIK